MQSPILFVAILYIALVEAHGEYNTIYTERSETMTTTKKATTFTRNMAAQS